MIKSLKTMISSIQLKEPLMSKNVETIEGLKSGGYSEMEIADMLDISVMDVYKHLSGEKQHVPKVIDEVKEEKLEGQEKLKADILSTAEFGIKQMREQMKTSDAQEIAKLMDSVSKVYTALFKNDTGVQITIQQNNLSMFKHSLKG